MEVFIISEGSPKYLNLFGDRLICRLKLNEVDFVLNKIVGFIDREHRQW